ncbi:MAG: hypothetical protein HRF44_09105 [Ignavibacterium sp.]|jgi:hypothetical protein
MNLGQTMLSAATLVVLAALVLNANRLIVEGEKDILKGEAFDLAVNHAQALLAEIGRKKFDAATADSGYQAPSEFTPAGSLGPDGPEASAISPWPDRMPFRSIAAYDDADDYNGYERIINTDLLNDLSLWVEVTYVSDTNPDLAVSTQTYFKRVTVLARHPSYLNAISFSTLVTN